MSEWVTSYGALILTVVGGIMAIVGASLATVGQMAKDKQNDALQQKLTNLTEETLTQVAGSPEAYLDFVPVIHPGDPTQGTEDRVEIRVMNLSDHPVISAIAWITNMTGQGLGEIPTQIRQLGDLYAHTPSPYVNYFAPLRKDIDNTFDITVLSRSVGLSETLVITWTGKKWEHDYSLARMDDGKSKSKPIKSIREDFPYLKKPTHPQIGR